MIHDVDSTAISQLDPIEIVLWDTQTEPVSHIDCFNTFLWFFNIWSLRVKMVPDPLLYTIFIILCLFGNCQGGSGGGGGGGGTINSCFSNITANSFEIILILQWNGSWKKSCMWLPECVTTTGDACVFPFTYYTSSTTSVTYTGCAPREVTEMHSEAWCSTMVDATGSHMHGHSGDCFLRRDGGNCRREG